MVIIDQLRLSDDGKLLYINAHINTASYFTNAYIDSVTITTADKVSETSPDVPTTNYIYKEVFEDDLKEISLVLTVNDFVRNWGTTPSEMNFKQSEVFNTLFFVYIKGKYVGAPDQCVPCELDKEYTLGIVFDESVLFNKIMGYTKELVDKCSVPQGFADLILLWNAFKVAVETGHYVSAIRYFRMLFDDTQMPITKKCNCHG